MLIFSANVEMDLVFDAVCTVTVPATKLPSQWSLRDRKHGKKASQIGKKKSGP